MKKFVFLSVFFITFLFLFSGAPSAQEVKIGVCLPLSGPVSMLGLQCKTALELAADIVNNSKYKDLNVPLAGAGGIPNLKGAKVKLVFSDNQGKPELGLSETERLITQEKVVVATGCFNSSITETCSMVAERMHVPFVTFTATSPKLTQRGFEWFFRSTPTDEIFTGAMFEFLKAYEQKKKIQFKTITLLYEDTLWGRDSCRLQKAFAAKAGYKVVADIAYRHAATSLIPEIMNVKAANADVFFPTSYVSDAILMYKTMKELNYNPPMVMSSGGGYTDDNFVKAVGKDIDGLCGREEFSLALAVKKPVIAQISKLYTERSGRVLGGSAAREFTGLLALCDAINRAGSTDPEAIREAISKTDIPGEKLITPWRGIKFDKTGTNILGDAIIVQYQDGGKPCLIYPFHLATKEATYPFPKWSERK